MPHIWKIACTKDGAEMISGIYKTRKEALGLLDDFKREHPTAENVTVIKWECCKSERKSRDVAPARALIHDPRMTAKASGATYEAFLTAGWTDDALIAEGYMKKPFSFRDLKDPRSYRPEEIRKQ